MKSGAGRLMDYSVYFAGYVGIAMEYVPGVWWAGRQGLCVGIRIGLGGKDCYG